MLVVTYGTLETHTPPVPAWIISFCATQMLARDTDSTTSFRGLPSAPRASLASWREWCSRVFCVHSGLDWRYLLIYPGNSGKTSSTHSRVIYNLIIIIITINTTGVISQLQGQQ